MSHVPGGLCYKRLLNIVRPSLAAPFDPFFSDVILLTPFDGVGTAPLDYSPLNCNPVIYFAPGVTIPPSVFAQTSDALLNGKNTLLGRMNGQNGGYRYIGDVSAVNIFGAVSTCVEVFYKQTLKYAATAAPPIIGIFHNISPVLTLVKFSDGEVFQCITPWSNIPFAVANSFDWNYFCFQYLAGQNKVVIYQGDYASGVATKIGDAVLFAQTLVSTYQANFFYSAPGPSVQINEGHIGPCRITAADRYGDNPSIAIPSLPFPLQ